jgi:ABC-2 type transport system permease protein
MSFMVAAIITVGLMIASAMMLSLPLVRVVYFAGTIAVMSAALSGLAVGLGALFPNFKEENPSKIVSGFGGTLCLVLSFTYNTAMVTLLAVPDVFKVTKRPFPFPWWFTPTIAALLSIAMIVVPMFLATRRVKSLEM